MKWLALSGRGGEGRDLLQPRKPSPCSGYCLCITSLYCAQGLSLQYCCCPIWSPNKGYARLLPGASYELRREWHAPGAFPRHSSAPRPRGSIMSQDTEFPGTCVAEQALCCGEGFFVGPLRQALGRLPGQDMGLSTTPLEIRMAASSGTGKRPCWRFAVNKCYHYSMHRQGVKVFVLNIV